MGADQAALVIRDLAKTFKLGPWHKASVALRNITLSVPTGKVYGYLGPNGAGKTTTLKLLFGLVRMEQGDIRVLGRAHADPTWRQHVGYLPEHPYLQDALTPQEYLRYIARLAGVPSPSVEASVAKALDRVGLSAAGHRIMRTFSKGMIQRAAIAQALVSEPDLLILDEPMSGLDPLGRAMVRQLIAELRDEGKTVFFSTHILSDAEALCDRVAILREGEVVSEGPLSEVLKIDVDHFDVTCVNVPDGALSDLAGVSLRLSAGSQVHAQVAESALPGLVARVSSVGGRVISVHPARRSLEEVFLKKVAKEASWEA